MQKKYWLFGLLVSLVLVTISCNSAASAEVAEEAHVEDDHGSEDADHAHAHVAPPRDFAGLANPFADDEAAIAAGKETYENLCATCHGPEGKGDGPAAEGLDPQPASLADGAMMRGLSEGYLFWRVTKGGAMEPFNSAMPAWETGLTEAQRWQVISYVRTLADNDIDHMGDEEHMEDHMEEGTHMEDEEHMDDHMEEEGHMEEQEEHTDDEHHEENN